MRSKSRPTGIPQLCLTLGSLPGCLAAEIVVQVDAKQHRRGTTVSVQMDPAYEAMAVHRAVRHQEPEHGPGEDGRELLVVVVQPRAIR